MRGRLRLYSLAALMLAVVGTGVLFSLFSDIQLPALADNQSQREETATLLQGQQGPQQQTGETASSLGSLDEGTEGTSQEQPEAQRAGQAQTAERTTEEPESTQEDSQQKPSEQEPTKEQTAAAQQAAEQQAAEERAAQRVAEEQAAAEQEAAEQAAQEQQWREIAEQREAEDRAAAERREAEQQAEEETQPEIPTSTALSLSAPTAGIQNNPVTDSIAESVLANGAGKIPSTGFPWQSGSNTYIAAHVYGYPGTGSWQQFARVPNMSTGDPIYLTDSNGTVYEYQVSEILTVAPTDVWVAGSTGQTTVSLQTCVGPNWSERLVVRGTLVGTSQA